MTWGTSILQRGVCGNFRFKFYKITDSATTNSVFDTDMQGIKFIASTQTTDKSDSWKAKPLYWTGTADQDANDGLRDDDQLFTTNLQGLYVRDNDDNLICFITGRHATDTDTLLLAEPRCQGRRYNSSGTDQQGNAAGDLTYDAFATYDEPFTICNDRYIMLTAVSANDDGYLIAIGK